MNQDPTVAPDGLRVAFWSQKQGEPNTVWLALTDTSIAPIRLGPGRQPMWSPDGRKLAYSGPQGLTIVSFGGLDVAPVHVQAAANAQGVNLTVYNNSDQPRNVRLQCELFDKRSVRLVDWDWSDEPWTVPANESLSSDIPLPEEMRETAATAKFTGRCDDAPRAVCILDLHPATSTGGP